MPLVHKDHIVTLHVEMRSHCCRGPRDWQAAVGSGKIFFDSNYQSLTGKSYSSWIMKCDKHPACEKKRVVNDTSTRNFGDIEPICFLHAWRDMPAEPGKKHSHQNPDLLAVTAQAEAHRDDFQRLRDYFK